MDRLTILGGRPLKGDVTISGSKNAALPILIATLLTDGPCIIRNVPVLDDIETVIALLVFLGKKINRYPDRIEILAGEGLRSEAPYELVRKMRASIVVMGPLLARLGRMKASLPGGCAIGGRPINIHLDGFRDLGASVQLEQGYVEVTAKTLRGAKIKLEFASVGATENLMMAAALAEGKTHIINAAREPEIEDLANFLNTMGAQVKGAGSKRITIQGVKKLHGAEHDVIPDRIEAGTYMLAAAMHEGDVTVKKMRADHLMALIAKMKKAGIEVIVKDDTVRVKGPKAIRPVNIKTEVHPGFPTDLQAQWMALMTLAGGKSKISERVFENRFMHVAELQRMGAHIHIKGNTSQVRGVAGLSGADVMVSDLRAGAALVLGGLAAKGKTVIHRVYHLDRGYENIEGKLTALGAQITRSKE